MADVLLTHSYRLHLDPKEERTMMPYPPLGTLYAAAVLREHGIDVAVHDVQFDHDELPFHNALRRHRPKLLVIYDDGFNYLTKMCLSNMRNVAYRMAALAHEAGITVAVFSSDATDHIPAYVSRNVDYVLCGEAEETTAELSAAVLDRSAASLEEIPGLAYVRNGSIFRTPKRGVARELDKFPFPARDLIELDAYRSRWMRRHGYFSLNVVTTRGCPFHCNWCAKPLYGQVYHSRSPENVAAELRQLCSTASPDHIWFCDDIFGLRPGWVEAFDRAVHTTKPILPYKCLSRADLLDASTVRHLRNSGCSTVWVGAESGSQRILDAMEKGTTIEQIHSATTRLRGAGVRVGFFLQFGYPGEGEEDIDATLRMVRECAPDEIGISVSYPLPGTSFYDRVSADLTSKQNWTDSGDLELMFAGTYPPPFYRALHVLTHKRFSRWRALRMLRNFFHGGPGSFRQVIRNVAVACYQTLTLPAVALRTAYLRRPVR
ncbi:MAG: hypothetical protein A3G43_05015 [Ignavibacteria bacterium RIFCSPLOWO2_12_FULL_56_21]|nr:MAG: hypothetical protein A3G43_05015 [Ignavibacteria bacterium RIFCSPLOWO2_12_FULL_56_21]